MIEQSEILKYVIACKPLCFRREAFFSIYFEYISVGDDANIVPQRGFFFKRIILEISTVYCIDKQNILKYFRIR